MAQVAKPFGLAPIKTLQTNAWNQQAMRYYIPSTDNNAYYLGDVVISLAGADTFGVPGVVKATAGTETLRGVIVGFEPANVGAASQQGVALSLENTGIPATKTKAYYAYVVDDPHCVFSVQDDGLTLAKLVAANANKNSSLTIAAGSSLQTSSGTCLLSTSIATTQGLNIRLYGLYYGMNNGAQNAFGLFAIWLCAINQHELMGNTAGI